MGKNRFSQRKSAQGYRSPGEREGCRSCADRSEQALRFDDGGSIAYDCLLGHFLVAPGGICPHYRPRPVIRTPKEST